VKNGGSLYGGGWGIGIKRAVVKLIADVREFAKGANSPKKRAKISSFQRKKKEKKPS